MCGLTGVMHLDRSPVGTEDLIRMTRAIAHRGPDGEGIWTGEGVGLGHRRLAIISPGPEGHQPMVSQDDRYVLVYNGELYNFRELRAQLASVGRPVHTQTDTEVILQAYAEWGVACLERFNGMFAFAIWDTVNRTLVLARDRFGVKPLYYAFRGKRLLFGSEIKAMLAHPDLMVRVSTPALNEYFTFQNVFTHRTMFEDVVSLPAGHFLKIEAGMSRHPDPVEYWDYEFSEDNTLDEETCIEELGRLFEQAVTRQLVSDVSVGSYLSGGIDSGSITNVASRHLPDLRTFTCGFDLSSASGLELSYDERPQAEYLANLHKTEHYEVVLKAGDMERSIRPLVWHLEELRVGQSYPNFYASLLASQYVKVVLSGTGGDELFAGYPWRYYTAANDNQSPDQYLGKYYAYWQRLIPDELKPRFFRPRLHDAMTGENDTRNIFKRVHDDQLISASKAEDYVNFSLYFELKTFLQGLLLVEDKLHMAHGVEARVPFLDNDLVDFASRIPVHHKLRNYQAPERLDENEVGRKSERYFSKTNDGKLILRKVLANYLPEEFAWAPKQGFSAPDASWFKGESVEFLRRILLSKDARIYEYLERPTVESLLSEHFSGSENRRLLIWSFLCFETWLEVFDPER